MKNHPFKSNSMAAKQKIHFGIFDSSGPILIITFVKNYGSELESEIWKMGFGIRDVHVWGDTIVEEIHKLAHGSCKYNKEQPL